MKRIAFVLITLIVFSYLFSNQEYRYQIYKNYMGWNLPKMNLMRVINEKTILIDGLPQILYEFYISNPNLSSIEFEQLNMINVKKLNELDTLNQFDLKNHIIETVFSYSIIKIGKENEKIIIYHIISHLESFNSAFDIFESRIAAKRILSMPNASYEKYGPFDSYIFDQDGDGIYEMKLILNQNEDENKMIKLIYNLITDSKKKDKQGQFQIVKKLAIDYLKYPTEENAKKFYFAIPNTVLYKEFNKKVQLNKRFWDFKTEMKKEGGPYIVEDEAFIAQSEVESSFWNWYSQNIKGVEIEIYSGKPYAVKLLFKTFPRVISAQFEKMPSSPSIEENSLVIELGAMDRIFENLVHINPRIFLIELKNHIKIVRIQDVLDGNFGLELIGRADLKYLQTLEKINSLKSVVDKDLIEIRDLCIEFLEKEKTFLKNNFYIDDFIRQLEKGVNFVDNGKKGDK